MSPPDDHHSAYLQVARQQGDQIISSSISLHDPNIGQIGSIDAVLSDIHDVGIVLNRRRLASANDTRCCAKCRAYFINCFKMPYFWWGDHHRRISNGYFGCEDIVSDEITIVAHVTWMRALVKNLAQEGEMLKYDWHKLNIFSYWQAASKKTLIVIFDANPIIQKIFLRVLQNPEGCRTSSDPHWMYPQVFDEIASLQNESVWGVRGWVRKAEKCREPPDDPNPDYPRLHDLARHSTHVLETLDVTITTAAAVFSQHKLISASSLCKDQQSKIACKKVHDRLAFVEQLFTSLRARATSNHKRLLNEINLAFNTVAQHDSRTATKIGRAAQSDGEAMKTIAFLTLTFLPATFVSSIFSMSFFNYDGSTDSWTMSRRFWVYWVVAIPTTLFTIGLWVYWNRIFPKTKVGGSGRIIDKEETGRKTRAGGGWRRNIANTNLDLMM